MPDPVDRPRYGSVFTGADYSFDELEWLRAIDRFRAAHHGRIPTEPEALQIAHDLGYQLTAPPFRLKRRCRL